LKQKQMAQFKLSSAKSIREKNTAPFLEELRLGKKDSDKKMLLALVEQQESRSKVEKADIVDNKGRSLVILLHGPPGVGKTLTAETLAVATGKPLFVVSVADVGLKADGVEAKLEKVFDLAAKWDAILLIDEADVFLESRSDLTTPNRNALVSVLLRVLEYYNGTIILTTNRTTSLDPAVQSRIHLAIRYSELEEEQGQAVFKNFLKKAGIPGPTRKKLETWFETEVSRKKLNGREIRNLVSSAQSLAKHNKVEDGLDEQCLRNVLYKTDEFKSQLQEQFAEWKVSNQGRRP
jgi:SpoVK/Ycf46/Vps4 family AAA+-type ATPase